MKFDNDHSHQDTPRVNTSNQNYTLQNNYLKKIKSLNSGKNFYIIGTDFINFNYTIYDSY